MEKFEENEILFRKLVANSLSDAVLKEIEVKERISFLAENVSKEYAKLTQSDFDVIFPLIMAFFDAMETENRA